MSPQDEERGIYLAKADSEKIIQKVRSLAKGGGRTAVVVTSWWNGELRWARNRVSLASDRYDLQVNVIRRFDGNQGRASTNQLDDVSLEAVVRSAERRVAEDPRRWMMEGPMSGDTRSLPLTAPATRIWSDKTHSVTAEARSAVTRVLTDEAEGKGMLSAGYLEMRAGSQAVSSNVWGDVDPDQSYQRLTQSQCSMTVRHPQGTGSGWAGKSSFDWQTIDSAGLARRALDKCLASMDAVKIEPGRYTVILEPQAVCQLLDGLMEGGASDTVEPGPLSRASNENYNQPGPFSLGTDETLSIRRTKLGQAIIDERLTISHDPVDPVLGVVTRAGLAPITWIKQGVLTSLHHSHEYAKDQLHLLTGELYRPAFQVSGGTTTMDEMIATTKRGLLVTRFSHISPLDAMSMLATGITRDGFWLIENGTITKAVKNMRFTESPLFALNQIEQLGVPEPVFRPVIDPFQFELTPAVIPPMKIKDFSFTALVDAV